METHTGTRSYAGEYLANQLARCGEEDMTHMIGDKQRRISVCDPFASPPPVTKLWEDAADIVSILVDMSIVKTWCNINNLVSYNIDLVSAELLF